MIHYKDLNLIKEGDEVVVIDDEQIVRATVLEIKKNWLGKLKYRCIFDTQYYTREGKKTRIEHRVEWFSYKNVYPS